MSVKMRLIKINFIYITLFLFIICQFFIWYKYTSKIKADFTITPVPPSKFEMNVFSLGDKSFLYRIYGFKLQNAGDTFGETTPLKEYDYEKLEKWFYALTDLDDKSEYVPSIAGFYFSSSQNVSDNKYVVDYLIDFADKNPEKYWRWYVTSAYITKYKLKDNEKAFSIAKKILNLKSDIPFINRAIVLFMLNERDLHTCNVVKLVVDLIESGNLEDILSDKFFSTKEGNYNFMFKLIQYKINTVIKDEKLMKKCLNR